MISTSLLRLCRSQHAGVFKPAITTVLKPAQHELPGPPSPQHMLMLSHEAAAAMAVSPRPKA